MSIVLKHGKIDYILDTPILPVLGNDAPQEVIDAYEIHEKDSDTVAYIMLAFTIPKLQKQHEMMDALLCFAHDSRSQ